MWWGREQPYYLKKGRLADVIAALQAMGAGSRPEASIVNWAKRLSGREKPDEIQQQVERWTAVFDEHPEFFLIYTNKDERKAALRWRYANKLFDPVGSAEYKPEDVDGLPEKIRERLTTRPLTNDQIGMLISKAIELHGRVIAEKAAKLWWIPLAAAVLGVAGAVLGAVLAALWKAKAC